MKRGFTGIILVLLLAGLVWGGWTYFRSHGLTKTPRLTKTAGYFDTLRYVQTRLRENPDHLPARYAAIIKNGTPEDLINFLRDRFEVIPPPNGWLSAETYINSGTFGALNGGVATPRELAELLANGLAEMGYEAKIVRQEANIPPVTMSRKPLEKSAFAKIDWKNIKNRIGGKPLPPLPPEIDNSDLWKRVAAAIPEEMRKGRHIPNYRSRTLPGVHFRKKAGTAEKDGAAENSTGWRLANLWADGEALRPVETKRSSPVSPRDRTDMIGLELLVKTTDGSKLQTHKVLQTRLSEDMIAGAHIRLGFAPLLGDPQAIFTTKPGQINRFQSYVKIESGSPDLSPEKSRFFGDIVTSRGEIGRVDENQNLVFGQKSLASGGDPKRVRKLKIGETRASHFPWIEVAFDPLDADNNVVTALPQSAFQTKLGDRNVVLNLVANTNTHPKIIFLIDASTSVAPEYRADKLHDVVLKMSREILAHYPEARFKVMVDIPQVLTKQWLNDPEMIAEKASSITPPMMSNYMWRSVIKAGEMQADAIIYFTDGNDVDGDIQKGRLIPGEGVGYEELPEDYKRGLAGAPPTFTLGGARLPDYPLGPAFEGIAKATKGKAFSIVDHQKAIDAIMHELNARLSVYRAYIRADGDISGKTLPLTLSINGIEATREIEIPGQKWRFDTDSVTGLYLVVKRRDMPATIHRLAGAPFRSDLKSIDETDRRNARLGLFGQYTLVAQPGTPSASQILDTLITERLSYEDVFKAETWDDKLQALARIKSVPRTQFAYVDPLPHIYEKGPGYWLDIKQRLILDGKEKRISRTDILPLKLYTDAPDSPSAFEHIFWASTRINDREGRLHGTDMSCLDGPLVLAKTFQLKDQRRSAVTHMLDDGRYYWPVIVPETGEITCLIGLDRASGAVLYYTDFGAAGLTVGEVEATFDQVDSLLSHAEELGGNIAAWASLEQAKMKALRMATIMILTMQPPDFEAMVRDEACSRLGDAADGVVEGGIGMIGGVVEEAWGAIGEISDIGEALGLGGIDTSVPIPGCD